MIRMAWSFVFVKYLLQTLCKHYYLWELEKGMTKEQTFFGRLMGQM